MSSASKQRWNSAHYTQVKVSINPEVAAAFKSACAAAGCSMASVLQAFMADYSQPCLENRHVVLPSTKKRIKEQTSKNSFATRKQRRAAINAIRIQMEQLVSAEENFCNNVPENLHGSKWHEAAESSIALINEILGLMDEIY